MESLEQIRSLYLEPTLFDEELDDWRDLWVEDNSLFENYKAIIKRFVILPWEDDLLPIVAGYLCTSAKWSKILPVMFCWGLQGSGKSTLANLAVALRGVGRAFSPNDTFASIRNEINILKYFDPEEKELKRDNTLMAWDNIYSSSFDADPKLYRLILVGYDAKQSIIRIAGQAGINIEFDVFCPKIISSIEAIHCASNLGELHRRLLIIPHRQIDSIEGGLSLAEERDLLQLTQIDWTGIDTEFITHWLSKDTCHNFTKWRSFLQRNVGKKTSKIKLPEHFTALRWTVSLDSIASIMACSTIIDPTEIIEWFGAYWSRIDSVCGFVSPLKEQLGIFIENAVGNQLEINAKARAMGQPPVCEPVLNASSLKEFMDAAYAGGLVDELPTIKKLSPIMAELGWKLTKKGWVQSF